MLRTTSVHYLSYKVMFIVLGVLFSLITLVTFTLGVLFHRCVGFIFATVLCIDMSIVSILCINLWHWTSLLGYLD